jgi:hypothetical protein
MTEMSVNEGQEVVEPIESKTNNLLSERIANLEYGQHFISRNVIETLVSFVRLTSPVMSKSPLIRIGGKHDGGYVVSDAFENKKAVSLGVGYEVSADLDLLERGFSIIAADGTVPNPFPYEQRYTFIPKNIGYNRNSMEITNLADILTNFGTKRDIELLLIDVEGHEYSILENELSIASNARQIVIEFHGLELLGDADFSNRIIRLISELRITHSPIHIHANNAGGGINLGGAIWPTIVEVTFAQNDLCESVRNFGPFPASLDFPNINSRPDMDLIPFYGKNPNFGQLTKAILGI